MDPKLNRAEEAARLSEERYRELLTSVTDYIYTVHLRDGMVVRTSHGHGCLAVTGYPSEEYARDPDLWHLIVHPDDTAAVVANAEEMARGKVPPRIEHRIFHRDGSVRWVRNQRVPRYDADGKLSGYDGLVSDITPRKEAEEMLTQANARLREVLASLTKSHAELQATQLQLIEAEKMQTVGQLAAGVALRFVKHELNAAKVKAATHFAGQLPLCALDRTKMKQALVNLFTNTCHAMPGGGALEITTRVWSVEENDALPRFRAGDFAVVVEIADGGTGISKEMFSKIFDPYFTTKPGKGTGLGLTVTKSIIDLHGGRINVSNRSAGGVAVTIALPSHNQDEQS